MWISGGGAGERRDLRNFGGDGGVLPSAWRFSWSCERCRHAASGWRFGQALGRGRGPWPRRIRYVHARSARPLVSRH